MPKKNKNNNNNNNNKNKNKGNVRNVIDNRHVWIEVSSIDITLLLQSNCGDGVYTIIDGDCNKAEYHTEPEFIEKRICPFCNPTSKIDHKVCKECAEQVIKHTINCDQICQYIKDHNCNCEYCQILAVTRRNL